LAWGAAVIAKRPPTARHTYGWRRATLLSPLANALLLVAFSGALGWEAIRRFSSPPEIPALPVIIVAAIGIAVNLGAAWFVREGHHHDLNRRGAFLHLMADAAVSLAAVLAGTGMLWLGWEWLDPTTGLLIGAVIAVGSFGLLRESFNAAMDAVPRGIDQAEVHDFLARQPGVVAVHHLHIWSLGAGEVAMTAHLVRPDDHDHDAFIDRINHELDHRFGINHPTLQVERGAACEHDRHDRAPHGH
jgi:cobalt-zinc-cadmium efflux system protein